MRRPATDFVDHTIEIMLARDQFGTGTPIPQSRLPTLHLDGPIPNDPQAAALGATQSTSARRPGTTLIETLAGPVWLSGSAVMCQCPQCLAPVSVRLWLMIADCWACDSAIELSYEQQQAARQLAGNAADSEVVRPSADVPAPKPRTVVPRSPVPQIEDEDEAADLRRQRVVQILRRTFSSFPAWLVSTLVHLILLLVLALILIPHNWQPESITLSTAVSPEDREGGIEFKNRAEDPLEFDSPPPPNFKRIERELREVRVAAEQDARELLIDPDPITPPIDLDKVKETVTLRSGPMYTLATRDPRLRNEIVRREGGTTLTEAAVARGLRWLASVQNEDGSWSLSRYRNHDDPKNRGDAAATSLALLPFLGAGQTHEQGRYKQTVARGLRWLIENQRSNGDLRKGIVSDAGMYAHGQAAIVLVEALAMTGDERFREPAQLAIDYIEKAQHHQGGWRYKPGQPGDTSVLGWQLMALQAARGSRTGLVVDDATLKLADYYLDLASRPFQSRRYRKVPSGSLYRYMPKDDQPKIAMTAEAMLCRMYLGWKRDDSRMSYAVKWLLKNALPDSDEMNLYYWYYATQVMHHYGGPEWEIWNTHLRDLLVIQQRRGGRYPGSWEPGDFEYGPSGGRIYVTALAVCTLEVYYRHLPLFKQLDLD